MSKKDECSYGYSSVIRREVRHSHGLDPEVPRHTSFRHKKNCKRNKGREHVAADHYVIDGNVAVLKCVNCEKHLSHKFQWTFGWGQRPMTMEDYVEQLNKELKFGL